MQAISQPLRGVVSSVGPEEVRACSRADLRTPPVENGLVWGSEREMLTPDRSSVARTIPMYRRFPLLHPPTLILDSICLARCCSGRQFLITEWEAKVSLRCTWPFGTCVKGGLLLRQPVNSPAVWGCFPWYTSRLLGNVVL